MTGGPWKSDGVTFTAEHDITIAAWDEPDGVAPRGTIIVLTGRGETPRAYQRLGRRLAADAYRVRVVTTDLGDLDATWREVEALLTDPLLPAPKVVAGTDAGALFALTAAPQWLALDGLILAGLVVPDGDVVAAPSWEAELESRSACPAHRRTLARDLGFARGALAVALPTELTASPLAPAAVPTLVVHGGADPVTSAETVVASFAHAESTRAVVVTDGRHDILNDVSHRSVSARIVLFLESLRLDPALPVIAREVDLSA